MRIIAVAALMVLAGTAGVQAAVNNYPVVSVISARYSGPPNAQGLFTMFVTINTTSCPSMAVESFEIPVTGVHGPGEALAKAEKIIPKVRADLEKDKLFCPK